MLKAKNNKWFLFQMLLVVILETKGNETGKYFNCVHDDYTTQLSWGCVYELAGSLWLPGMFSHLPLENI